MPTALAGLAGRIDRAPWFGATGEALSAAELGEAALYLAGLGRADHAIEAVVGWEEAKAASIDPAWDRAWWEDEEAERRALRSIAAMGASEAVLHEALTEVTEAARTIVEGAASLAASRAGHLDPGLVKAAAGAASQACFHAGLAWLAGAGEDHPFAAKFRLFEGGRWPLAVIGNRFYLF